MTALQSFTTSRYANVIAVSRRVRWEIERDVLDAPQVNRIEDALAPLAHAVPLRPGIQHPMPLRAA